MVANTLKVFQKGRGVGPLDQLNYCLILQQLLFHAVTQLLVKLQLQERRCEGEILIETRNQSFVFVRQPVNSENRNERGN